MELIMEYLTSVLVGVGLAMDAFAVSLGIGTAGQADSRRAKLRMAFHLGWFQMMMTVLGWLAGSTIAGFIHQFDHWIAMALLGYVGSNMIRSGLNPDEECYRCDPTRGKTMIILCVATSIDAMAVGLSMAMLKTSIWIPSIIIGVVTFIISSMGLLAGNGLGAKFGKRMQIVGGLILIGIGLRVIATHLL
jgi:putative Mn2+ efflux pump MntP